MAANGPSEASWQRTVVQWAAMNGWRWYHAPDNRPVETRSGRFRRQRVVPGFPDLVLVRGARLIFAELKTDSGRVSPEQRAWLADFEHIGRMVEIASTAAVGVLEEGTHLPSVEVYTWRPRDWPEVEVVLARTEAA